MYHKANQRTRGRDLRSALAVGGQRGTGKRAIDPPFDMGSIAILVTDIEASSTLAERVGDSSWLGIFDDHRNIVREQLWVHRGLEVKSRGDGMLAIFPESQAAVRCAVAIQQETAKAACVRVAIGIHAGPVLWDAGDVCGLSVIIATRLTTVARGEEILVSDVLRQLLEQPDEFSFEDVEDVALKGLKDTHLVNRISWRAPQARRVHEMAAVSR